MSTTAVLVGLIAFTNAIRISTKLGEIEGITAAGSIHQFLSIPYAKPPINELRWRPPQPMDKAWTGVYDATAFGNACAQPTLMHFFSNDSTSQFVEDCLYLNVFTPFNFNLKATEKLRNVFFWIHGGGLTLGTAMSQMYNATTFVSSQDIVVVTINYRLGKMAWFADPLQYESPTGNGGATGFLDMIEALKWVRNNIESFGGNPNEITIAGESGGGWGVCGLMLSPLARGLFKRSIQMSGSCVESLGRFRSTAEGYKMTKRYATDCNVSSVEELRSMDAQTIIDCAYGSPDQIVLPATDGYVFPMDTIDLLKAGYINGESTMIGTVFRESFSAEPINMGYAAKDAADLHAIYERNFHDAQVALIKQYYSLDAVKNNLWKRKTIFDGREALLVQTVLQTDCWVRCGSILQSEMIANHPLTANSFPVYFYQYGSIQEPWDRFTHGVDIVLLFGDPAQFDKMPTLTGNFTEMYNEEFAEITRSFFGGYAKGIVPVKDNKPASIQNGYYLHVVDKVRSVAWSEMDETKQRCGLFWDHLGREAYDHPDFCFIPGPVDSAETATQNEIDPEDGKQDL